MSAFERASTPGGATHGARVNSLASGAAGSPHCGTLNTEEDRPSDGGTGKLVLWRVLDGKAGHESQTAGLAEALGRRVAMQVHDLSALPGWKAWLAWLTGRFFDKGGRPEPDLIVGAGHRSHATLLAARRAAGGRTVVLMRPSLPLRWFDLCLIPEHDNPPDAANVIATTGMLNTIRSAESAAPDRGLILVGGPSASHGWDPIALIQEVEHLAARGADIEWTLTTSRRTPAETARTLGQLAIGNLTVVPFAETGPGWVQARLEECGRVWVTEDSMSMIFEALTAGAEVGVLSVPRRRPSSRVARAVDRLRNEERVRSGPGAPLAGGPEEENASPPLAEADRCAELILKELKFAG